MPDDQRAGALCAALYTLPVPSPAAPSADPVPTKSRRHFREREFCGKYVRALTHRRLYQLRVWCPLAPDRDPRRGFSCHCGLFATVRAAREALRELSRMVPDPYTPLDVWRAVVRLQGAGVIPTGRQGPILPLWVRRRENRFVATCTRLGVTVSTPPRDTPEEAHVALWSVVVADGVAPEGARAPFTSDRDRIAPGTPPPVPG